MNGFMPPYKIAVETAVGAGRSAVAVHVASRRRLGLLCLGGITFDKL